VEPGFGEAGVIGRRVSVRWTRERKSFSGQVVAFHPKPPDFLVLYEDGDLLWGHALEDLKFEDNDGDHTDSHELAISDEVTFLEEFGP
jgi:hypothetical protein